MGNIIGRKNQIEINIKTGFNQSEMLQISEKHAMLEELYEYKTTKNFNPDKDLTKLLKSFLYGNAVSKKAAYEFIASMRRRDNAYIEKIIKQIKSAEADRGAKIKAVLEKMHNAANRVK